LTSAPIDEVREWLSPLEPDEVREWFRERGGDVEKLETVLDYCWNFPKPQTVVIANPRLPRRTILDPALDSTA